MHDKERATSARKTWRYPLLLALGMTAGTAAAQAPAGAPKPATAAPAGGTPAASTPAAGTPAASTRAASTPAASTPAASTRAASTRAASAPTASTSPSSKAKRKLPLRACPAQVPEELNPPPDVTLETVLPASGVQSYACAIDKPGEAPDWAPKGPHAMLGEPNNLMGIHFGGPSWQAMDGSLVKGAKVSSASAPDKSAIAWLLLSGAPSGEGIFGKITHIQRMDTVGGRPPQGGCDANHLDTRVLVPYRTNYYFYRESEPGEKVRQCRGAPGKQAAGEKGGNKPSGDKPKDKDKAVSAKGAEKPAAGPAGERPAGEKPASKPAAEKATRSAPEKAATEKPATEKSATEKSANKGGAAKNAEKASAQKATTEKSGAAKSE